MVYKVGNIPDNPFKKGHTPWNKDKKLGKGMCPNWCRLGTRRIDTYGYRRIKVFETGKWSVDWPLLHKVNWVKKNGPISAGLVFWFKDRNKLNCVCHNLELITKPERMRRNSLYTKILCKQEEIIKRRGSIIHVNSKLRKLGYIIKGITTVHKIL